MKHILSIADSNRKYRYIVEPSDNCVRIYAPDFRPAAFGETIDYRLEIVQATANQFLPIFSVDFKESEFLACAQIRYEGHTYNNFIEFDAPININSTYYVSLIPLKNGKRSSEYFGSQEAIMGSHTNLRIDIVGFNNNGQIVGRLSDNFFKTAVKSFMGDYDESFSIDARCVIKDDSNIYYKSKVDITDEDDEIYFDIAGDKFQFKSNADYIEGLFIVAIVHFKFETNESDLNLDLRSVPFPLTPPAFAEMISASQKKHTVEIPKEMKINNIRLVSKTEQKIINMAPSTPTTKSNLIQPIFYRARELAQIIIHPSVSENICVNLDSYKSLVDRFYLNISGVSFPEIGRIESGVIFKITGSLLKNLKDVGVYYILNENSDLVTSGKYISEA